MRLPTRRTDPAAAYARAEAIRAETERLRMLADLKRQQDAERQAERAARRAARDQRRGSGVFYGVAAVATGVSIDTSWRFFGERLHITALPERVALFAVLELAYLACGYSMRASVRRGDGPGRARILAWALCGLSGYMAVDVAGPVEGVARVALGAVLALVSLHLALGIDLRAHGGSRGKWAEVVAELRERALSRLGLGDDARTAVERTKDRAVERAVRLATGKQTPRRRRKLERAIHACGAATDPVRRGRLLAKIDAIRHLDDLTAPDTSRPSPWRTAPAVRPAPSTPTPFGLPAPVRAASDQVLGRTAPPSGPDRPAAAMPNGGDSGPRTAPPDLRPAARMDSVPSGTKDEKLALLKTTFPQYRAKLPSAAQCGMALGLRKSQGHVYQQELAREVAQKSGDDGDDHEGQPAVAV